MEILNRNFNLMTDKLKNQQEKLLISERHEAWGNLARKLAHKLNLTPIQLTIDRIKHKYLDQFSKDEQKNFNENLKIINNQIKQIENLVNEFSDFARMPKPILKDYDLVIILKENIKLLSEMDKSIDIKLKKIKKVFYLIVIKSRQQRFFFIKNSIDIHQIEKNIDFVKKISIEIN